ncbi:MAG: hypothetical protein SFX18_02180 [Pirellulales bacterium]|nr:hypothetical protein [Pirellulales bacterium]
MILIGWDEAGYGPPLGPLVVAVSAWRVPDDCPCLSLYHRLRRFISPAPPEPDNAGPVPPLWIADSKLVHGRGGFSELERGVLSLSRVAAEWLARQSASPTVASHQPVSTDLLNFLAGLGMFPDSTRQPWEWREECALPLAQTPEELFPADKLARELRNESVELLQLRAAALWPAEYNAQLARNAQNKSLLLFDVGAKLVRELLNQYAAEPVEIFADKQGARNRYGAMLQNEWELDWINVELESQEASHYTWRTDGVSRGAHFLVNGERALPTAAASMTAKYVRELAMRGWNHFWCGQMEQLRPTAGYTVDARRFILEIRPRLSELAIADEQVIRWK